MAIIKIILVNEISNAIAKFYKFNLNRVQLNKKVTEIRFETKYVVGIQGQALTIIWSLDPLVQEP